MFKYMKLLAYPINITTKDLDMAKYLMTQYGGDDGELRAAIRYLNQRFTMPTNESKALLTDIGCEELGHIEMVCTMYYQLVKNATLEELEKAGLGGTYSMHGKALFPVNANGVPTSVVGIGASDNYKADLIEDMAAEEKAKVAYEHLMDMTNNPEILGPLAFLREREVVHFTRFGEMFTILSKEKDLN